MKILFILPRYHTNQYFWTKTLQERGHEVRYLVFEKNPSQETYALATPIEVQQKPFPRAIQAIMRAYMRATIGKIRPQFLCLPDRKDLQKHIVDFAPDVVVIREIAFPLSFFSFRICKQLRIPAILYNQYPLELPERPFTRLLQMFGIVPRRRITPTRREQDMLTNEKTGAMYVPLITDFPFNPTKKIYAQNGVVTMLFVGKFASVRKNHLLLLDALNTLRGTVNFRLVMAGDDMNADPAYMAAIQERIKKYDLGGSVTLRRNIPYEDMHKLYRAADLFVLPSANEAFSVSPIEAMNYGLPVIVTDTNGAQHCIENGVNGYVVRTNDADDLVDKLTRIVADTNVLERMGHNAFQYQKEHLSPEVMYKQFMDAVNGTRN